MARVAVVVYFEVINQSMALRRSNFMASSMHPPGPQGGA